MPIFNDVISWSEYRDDVLFWKWGHNQVSKGSRLIIKPGQDAVFLNNGKIDHIFEQEGNFRLETDIIPILSNIKGIRFGFKTGYEVEVVFVNTKEMIVNWGTPAPILLPNPTIKGGIPIRSHGNCTIRIADIRTLIENVSGIKNIYTLADIQERIQTSIAPIFIETVTNNAIDIFDITKQLTTLSNIFCEKLNDEFMKIGLSVTNFNIINVSYPENIQKMIEKVAANSFVDDVEKYKELEIINSFSSESGNNGSSMDKAFSIMGMNMLQQQMQNQNINNGNNLQQNQTNQIQNQNTNQSLQEAVKFCMFCGFQLPKEAVFCSNCGKKQN